MFLGNKEIDYGLTQMKQTHVCKPDLENRQYQVSKQMQMYLLK